MKSGVNEMEQVFEWKSILTKKDNFYKQIAKDETFQIKGGEHEKKNDHFPLHDCLMCLRPLGWRMEQHSDGG
jgi:hypothetical protein